MADDSDILFAKIIVEQGLVTQDQIDECLQLRRKLAATGVNPVPHVGELLVRKGFLSARKLQEASSRGGNTPPTRNRTSSSGSTTRLPAAVEKASADEQNVYGKYIRLEKLGAGGMGEVWKGYDTELRRWVALKFLLGGDEEESQRFQREAQTAAALSHPNIAAIFEATDRFIVMQYIEGHSLNLMPRTDRVKIVEHIRDVARAVHYANGQGVIHRDLKPHNIMLDKAASPPRVYVMDFGLAKQMEVDSSISVSGAILGTPAYMPPEQARGEMALIGVRSDVYSLGATLYELMADRPPFRGANTYELLKKVEEEDPKSIRHYNPRVARDLDTIVMKCLEKEPHRRFDSAGELADDLTRWLDGEPIHAHPPSTFYRLRKKIAKRKGIVIAGAVGVVGVVVALAVLLPMLSQESEKKEQATRALELWGNISNLFNDAELYLRAGERDRARKRLDDGIRLCREHIEVGDSAYARYFLGRLLRVRGDPDKAEKELDRAVVMDPALGEARFERGLLKVGRYTALYLHYRRQGAVTYVRGEVAVDESIRRLEEAVPEMQALKNAATEDLEFKVGQSSFFREEDSLYGRAELARLRGRWEEAEQLLTTLLERDPLYVRALRTRAALLLMRGFFQESVAVATRAIDLHKGLPHLFLIRAEAASLLGETDSALRDAQTAVDLDPENTEVLDTLGQVLTEAGRFQEAIRIFDRVIRTSPLGGASHNNRGICYHRLGQYDRALEDLNLAAARQPTLSMVYFNRCLTRQKLGNLDAALEDIRTCIEKGGAWAPAYHKLGFLLREKGRREEALDALSRAVQMDPQLHLAYMDRAIVHSMMGNPDSALEDLDRALDLAPNHAPLYFNRGNIYLLQGKFDEALLDYNEALKQDPDNARFLSARGGVYFKLRQLNKAIRDCTRAVEIDENLAEAFYHRAQAYYRKSDLDRARNDYSRVIELKPRLTGAWVHRGTIHIYQGRPRDAVRDFTEAIRLDPDKGDAYFNRGLAYMQLGDNAAAERDFSEVVLAEPKNAKALTLRGRMRMLRGNKDGAIQDLEKVMKMTPPDWEGRATVEQALRDLKN